MSSLSSPSQADPPESGVREQHKEMLRQHQSMSSLPTRSRADQPNSGVWERHKETLRQLYLLQGKPLKQVMKIMHQEHDFVATDKMYKYHFHRWKFRKNLTKEESRKHEADAVAGRAVVLPESNGRGLGSQRLKARILKSLPPDVTYKVLELKQHPMQHSPRSFTPNVFNYAEHALVAIQGHSRVRSKSLPNYHQDNAAAELWAARMRLAAQGISTQHDVDSNYKILNRSVVEFASVLQKQEPILVWSTFTVIIDLLQLNAKLGLAFIRVVAEFYSNLPNADPLQDLWAAILQIDPGTIPEVIARLTAAQIDCFRREIGTNNQFVLNYIRTSAKHLHDHGLLARQSAHEQMDEVISTLRFILNSGMSNSASAADRLIAACLFKACFHIDGKEYQEVEMILDEVDPGVDLANKMSKPQLVNFYEIKAEMRLKRGKHVRGDYEASEQYYWKALSTAQQHLAKELPTRIAYCLSALGNYYAAMGNTEAVERVRALYEEHLGQMADDVDQHPPFDVATVKDARKFETGRHLELEKAYRREVEEVLQSRASLGRMGHVEDVV
ncbi:hypothetical protein BJ166DRAFT_336296 [Pestalotiopsis sp. NC0098]|nr:hypothetical protein BJ166DRAFT_336296 [Pestalotiopsis sp. NC0098]